MHEPVLQTIEGRDEVEDDEPCALPTTSRTEQIGCRLNVRMIAANI